jgi:hypothetical protein
MKIVYSTEEITFLAKLDKIIKEVLCKKRNKIKYVEVTKEEFKILQKYRYSDLDLTFGVKYKGILLRLVI